MTVLTLLGLSAVAGAGRSAGFETVEVTTSHESWYHVTPLNAPSLLPPAGGVRPPSVPPEVPSLSPFAANRLQVGLVAGVESARTYLRLAAGSVDGEVVGGVLRLPLDLDPGAGSLLPDSSGLVACVARGVGPEVEGSFGEMPSVDCGTTSPVIAGDGAEPVLTVDLAPFGFLVQDEGIALIPSPAEVAAQDTWRVAIRGADPAEPGQGISATLVVDSNAASEPSGGDGSGSFDPDQFDSGGFGSSGFDPGDYGSGASARGSGEFSQPFDLGAPGTAEPSPSVPPVADFSPETPAEPFAPIGLISDGFAYSSVLLLPLGLIAAFGWFGLHLTRPIENT